MRIFARVLVFAVAVLSLIACGKLEKEGTPSKDPSLIHLLCAGAARIPSSEPVMRMMFSQTVPYEVSLTLDEKEGKVVALTESALTVLAFIDDTFGKVPDSILNAEYFGGVGRCSLQGTEIDRVMKVTHAEFTIQTLCPSGAEEPDEFPWLQTYVINRLDGSFKFGGGYGVMGHDGSQKIENIIRAQGKCAIPTERRF